MSTKIAFIQLGSFGDCINSTLMILPIRKHFGQCTIDVHTTTFYQSAFANNPYVDKITAHEARSKSQSFDLYNVVPKKVEAMGYDEVFSPAPILHPARRNSLKHPEFGENLITTFMRYLEDRNIHYDWPVQTILRLTFDEIRNVSRWISDNKIQMIGRRSILMEVEGESGQTFWDPNWTLATARHLMASPSTNLFISRREKTGEIALLCREFPGRVWWAGDLTVRECAELYNRCSTFMSVSSGLSNACNTNYCRTDKQWVETVNSPTVTSAPVRSSGKIFWYERDLARFLEMLRANGV